MSNFYDKKCNPIDYYTQQKYAQLEEQIYYLKQSNALFAKYLQSTCITPVFSLINYTTTIGAPNNPQFLLGSINYYQVVITNSFNGDRIWTFTLGGYIYAPAFWIIYQFDPNCVVPNGFDFASLKDINFYVTGSTTVNEPLQGTIIVSNINISISLAPSVVNLVWDQINARLIFQFNLRALKGVPGFEAKNAAIQKLQFSQQTPQSLFLSLTVKDIGKCSGENCTGKTIV